jgi:type II secretory pathway pseudopilin PulG
MLRQTNRRRGFSLVAMLFVVLIVLVITVAAVTVAVPEFNSGHRASNELGAIKAIQTIHQAEVQHKSQSAGMPVRSRKLAAS